MNYSTQSVAHPGTSRVNNSKNYLSNNNSFPYPAVNSLLEPLLRGSQRKLVILKSSNVISPNMVVLQTALDVLLLKTTPNKGHTLLNVGKDLKKYSLKIPMKRPMPVSKLLT